MIADSPCDSCGFEYYLWYNKVLQENYRGHKRNI